MQDALENQRIEVLLDIQKKQLQEEFNKLHSELRGLREELSKLGREVRGVRQDSPQNFQPSAPEQPRGIQQPTAHVQKEAAASTQPVDRNGVSPADVSIEKFFYTGSNPR